ncbi:unnamed protein product [Camellia sinensis]
MKEMQLLDLPASTHLWKGPTQLVRLCNLTFVEVKRCDKLKSMFSVSIARDVRQLQTLKISRCRMMEVLISSDEQGDLNEIASATTHKIAINAIKLPQLNQLILCKIPKLNSFCNASESNYNTIQPLFNKVELIAIEKLLILSMHNVIEIWPGKLPEKLRDVIIFRCPKLLNILFPSNLIKGMQSLEQGRLEYCQSVEVVFDLEGVIVRKGYSDILLPSLTQLMLLYLPKLTHVWKDNLPRIQGFQNLTSLIISGCGNLRNIFSPSQARLLVKLQKIKVAECGALEAIVGEEPKVDDEVAADIIMFPQLSSLELYHLPNLRSICPQAYTVEGSFLKKIEVINCPNMKALPSAFQGIPELQESNVQKVDFFGSAQHHLWDGNLR